MKTILAIAAVLGLSAGAAMAECAGHMKTTASNEVDRDMTTASIAQTEMKADSAQTVAKTDVLKKNTDTAE